MGGRSRVLTGPWPAIALVVLLLAGLAVVTTVAGPAQFGAPRIGALAEMQSPFDSPDDSVRRSPAEPDPDTGAGLPGWTAVVWAMALGAALVLLARWIVRLVQDAGERDGADGDRPADETGDARLVALLRRGLAQAGQALDEGRPGADGGDAVIRCWLALETGAARAGTGRGPAQTATEFTTALLAAQHADPDAVADLLGLYHRARYGNRPLDQGATARARDALDRIAASLPLPGPPRDAVATSSQGGAGSG